MVYKVFYYSNSKVIIKQKVCSDYIFGIILILKISFDSFRELNNFINTSSKLDKAIRRPTEWRGGVVVFC